MGSSIIKFQNLLKKIPRPAVFNWGNMANCNTSSYINNSWNIFYSMGCGFSENITYCYWVYSSKNCFDCSYSYSCESCYECIDCNRCYNCNYCTHCLNDSYLSHCCFVDYSSYCFGCVGLKNKTYYIFNKKYTQKEYEKKMKKISKMSKEEIEKKIAPLMKSFPLPHIFEKESKNVTGNYLDQCENLIQCFDCYQSRNSMYCSNSYENVDSVDNSFSKVTFSYENVGGGMYYNCYFCLFSESCHDCFFCFNCKDCKNCFGCVNLTHKRFYIFNQPYTEKAYFDKVALLKKEFIDKGMYSLDVYLG